MDITEAMKRRITRRLNETGTTGLTTEQLVDLVTSVLTQTPTETSIAADKLARWNQEDPENPRFVLHDCSYTDIVQLVIDVVDDYATSRRSADTVFDSLLTTAAPIPVPPAPPTMPNPNWPFPPAPPESQPPTALWQWQSGDWVEWSTPKVTMTGVVTGAAAEYGTPAVGLMYVRVGVSTVREVLVPTVLLRGCPNPNLAKTRYEADSPTDSNDAYSTFTNLFATLRANRDAFYRLVEHIDKKLAERQAGASNRMIRELATLSGVPDVHPGVFIDEETQFAAAMAFSEYFRAPLCARPHCTKPAKARDDLCEWHAE